MEPLTDAELDELSVIMVWVLTVNDPADVTVEPWGVMITKRDLDQSG